LLSQLAVIINSSKLNMSIEGHTDSVPINNAHFPSNWELSSSRATMVTRHLIANNIAPDRVRAIGYADTRPRLENDTSEGRKHNRRVSIILHMPEPDAPLDALVGIRQ
jgi:chemotaxis protein MotB